MGLLSFLDKLDDGFVKNGIIVLLWAGYIWKTYLSIRQYQVARNAVEIPKELRSVMKKEEYDKARNYSLAKLKFGFVKNFHSIVQNSFFINFNYLAAVWGLSESIDPFSDEVSTSCIWMIILQFVDTIIVLPYTIYYTFFLEEKFGFNKQTAGFFVWDQIKQFLVFQMMITSMVVSIVIVIVKKGGDYFFIWLSGVVGLITFILIIIYPALIAPLFDEYTPLHDGQLRTNIEALASEVKFPLTQIYVVEGSKRSSHSNAYLTGLFKSKRIVLYDTILEEEEESGLKDDEILAVLSHELGHWSCNHIFKNLIIQQLNLFLLFFVFGTTFKYHKIYTALGFYKTRPVFVGLFVVLEYIMMPYNTFSSFLVMILSRKFEFEADDFAVNLDKGVELERALLKTYKDNSEFPVHDWLFSAWHHTHPPLLQRIDAIRKGIKKFEGKKNR